MAFLARFFPDLIHAPRRERIKLFAMMGLFFLVVCAVGILRPIKNSLALDGLGATDFYKVYLVSAAVVLFGPIHKQLADRVPWRSLFVLVALFFASNLVVFRVLYVEGSATFGVLFYGWYDLFSAALVTQFFMATQLFLNARSAKQAYPLVIGGGAIGATIGGLITGLTAQRIGAPNLLLVAAAIILLFAAGLPFIYSDHGSQKQISRPAITTADALWQNKHIRLIAASVLLTVVVKELVDYQFNLLSKEVFETRDAVSAFQGRFNAVTQWLPLGFVLLLHPLLKRFGVGIAVMLLPAALLVTNAGLVLWWGLIAASAAKGAETGLRYSAERAAREILYLPTPEHIRLTAKPYIDVVIEKGVGKALSAVVIFLLLQFITSRQIAYVSLVLAGLAFVIAVALRKEYVRTLAKAIEGRFASFRGLFATLLDASTLPRIRVALQAEDALQVAFALDLLEQAPPAETGPLANELRALLRHPADAIRVRTVALLARASDEENRQAVEAALDDDSPAVREAAVRALILASHDPEPMLLRLVGSPRAHVRTAVLAQLARLDVSAAVRERVAWNYTVSDERQRLNSREARIETAYAAQALGVEGWRVLLPLLSDADTEVANASLRAASALHSPELLPACVAALRSRALREAARSTLRSYGVAALPALSAYLLDPGADPTIRRLIPGVLARVPSDQAVSVLLRAISARETDQVLDFRAIKALGKLRARFPDLRFPGDDVRAVLQREAQAAERYALARHSVAHTYTGTRVADLLLQALTEAWRERRECAFRLLALLHAPSGVLDAYSAVCSNDMHSRGNALEWLEHEIGYDLIRTLAPVLTDPEHPAWNGRRAWDVLPELRDDEDSWIAACARALNGHNSLLAAPSHGRRGGTLLDQDIGMDIIERVFLLQRVDLLQGARSAHLALLAAIAEEINSPAHVELLEQGRPAAAMYILVRGAVELRGLGVERMLLQAGTAFGTWALIDDAPSLIGARVTETSQLLRINRADFFELLEDTPELALGLLQGLARRVRTLVA
ncbi:MAG: Npt1/Npt2 family nucleotide transporter [Gemmatimonadota bacterium]